MRALVRRVLPVSVVTVLLAAACGTGGEDVDAPPIITTPDPGPSVPDIDPAPPDPAEPSTPATTSEEVRLPPVTIEQIDCPEAIRSAHLACALATVPVDRADPQTATTTISIAALAGTDEQIGTPLAVLQGGPGGASTELTSFYPRREFTQVFVDQRGTGFGGSDFDCPEVDAAMVEILGARSARGEVIELDAYADCARRIGDDPVFLATDTTAHAADVVDVMTALGHRSWLVYGVSYGTPIALELMREPPPGLVGSVLDSVYPTDLDVDRAVAESARGALAELDRSCASDADCSIILDDVSGTLYRLLDRLDDEPVAVSLSAADTAADEAVEVVIDGDTLAGMVFRFLYSESRLRFVPGLLDGLDRGDDATERWLARAAVDLSVAGLEANDDGTYFAVQCADRLPFVGSDPLPRDEFTSAIAEPGLHVLCDPWDREPAPGSAGEPVSSDIPTLIVGGQFDPITPPTYAARVAADLTTASVVIRDGRGHGVWAGDDCIAGVVSAFVIDPGGALDTSCADDAVPVDWARPG